MITVRPYGGLANRMRVIDSAFQLAKRNNASVKVIWELSDELNCPFDSLFETLKDLHVEEVVLTRTQRRMNEGIRRIFQLVKIRYPFGYSVCLHDKEILKHTETGYDLNELVKSSPDIFIRTVHKFYEDVHSFEEFVPVLSLKEKIEGYAAQYSDYTIGLHIRRTDNKLSIKFSPLSGFTDRMDEAILKNQDTKFFLATDSPGVEEQIKSKFGNRIIAHPKTLDRNTASAIQDSVVDLYCLSKTKRIVGSFYSSFSEVAARINNIELIQVYKNSKESN
jgi:hypothetical protein